MASGIGSPSPCSAGSDEEEMEILMNNSIHQHQGTPQGETPVTSLCGGGGYCSGLSPSKEQKRSSALCLKKQVFCFGVLNPRGCQLDHGGLDLKEAWPP